MGETLTHEIIRAHLVEGEMNVGTEIGICIDQTLVQDATGTMVWMQFQEFGIPRVKNRVSVTYVDHNILQTMAEKYGAIFSRASNGISHFAHLERFDVPGETLLGSDSHTCTAGAMGMLAIGAGGAEVAAAMGGRAVLCRDAKVEMLLAGGLRKYLKQRWAGTVDSE